MEFSSALVINTLANQFVTGDILDLKIVIKNILHAWSDRNHDI